jgi:uncharacterized protein involved in cysteine biosynthesis
MHEVTVASLRAMREFSRGDILWQALWPPLVSFFGWAAVAWFTWMPLSGWLLANLPQWPWFSWLGPWLVPVVLVLLFAPLVYVTTLLLIGAFALPKMMAIVAARDYPEVSRHGTPAAALWGSLGNALGAGAIFVAGWLLCLPLLLIPGGLLVLPVLWSAWLNQRMFRFEALAEHASPTERREVIGRERWRFRAAGLVSALAAQVPLLNILAPAFAALLFTHLGLAALARLRDREGIWVSEH